MADSRLGSSQQPAEHYYRLALRAEPRNLRSLRGLSDILPDKSDERLAVLELAAEIAPGTITLIDLGDHYRSVQKDFERAYSLYCQAQQLAPKDQTAYLRLNDICRRLGRPDEAKEWSQKWKDTKDTRRVVGRGSK